MKKLFGRCFNAILILALTFALCPAISTMAEEDVSAFIMDGSTITGYTGSGGDVVIPASVTAIADYAFAGNTAITSVTIPANVTSVGSYAFSGCTGLGNAVFGGPVSLGEALFMDVQLLGMSSFRQVCLQLAPRPLMVVAVLGLSIFRKV